METDEEGFLAGDYFGHFNAAVYILRRSDALWIVNLLRAQTRKNLTARSLGT